jgi:hypothetical protein
LQRSRFQLTAAILLAATPVLATELRLGDGLPVSELREVQGDVVRLDAPGDEGMLVIFVSSDCAESVAAEATIHRLALTNQQRMVRTIVVDAGEPGAQLDRRWAHVQHVSDAEGATARALGATRAPEAFLFDRRGRLVYHGAVEAAEGRLEEALDAIVARQPVPVPKTTVAGCPLR